MYYPDLTPYEYEISGTLEDVLNIGWLSKEHSFQTGVVEDSIIEKLKNMIVKYRITNQMRGTHECDLCSHKDPYTDTYLWFGDGKRRLLGSAELWIPSSTGIVYAAPDMIYHYITEHYYYPPNEFLMALKEYHLGSDWSGDETRKILITQYIGR